MIAFIYCISKSWDISSKYRIETKLLIDLTNVEKVDENKVWISKESNEYAFFGGQKVQNSTFKAL